MFKGADITHIESFETVRSGMGLVPQGRRVFPTLSVEENLLVAERNPERHGWNLSASMRCSRVCEERRNQRAKTLSGGEQQMLAIGRGLMTNPDCLIMDEPSEGLAPIIIQGVWEAIGKLKEQGLSILLVEQNAALALKLVDYVHVISKGQVVYSALPQELWANDEIKSPLSRHLSRACRHQPPLVATPQDGLPSGARPSTIGHGRSNIRNNTEGEHIMKMNRRTVIKGALAAGVATSALKVPAAVAQAGPIKVGFLTIKTGPLASGGLQMEQGLTVFFKERDNKIAGRAVELHTADTAGNPAQARTKTQELVERFNVSVLIGPLAAFEALAIDDYIRSSQDADPDRGRRRGHDPAQGQSLAGAAELRRRRSRAIRSATTPPRSSSSSASPCSPTTSPSATRTSRASSARSRTTAARWCRRCVTPLNAPDYGTYISQLKPNLDCGLSPAHAGSNGFKFIKQLREYGNKVQILGGFTPVDELLLQQMGEDGARRHHRQLVFGRSSTTRSTSGSSPTIQKDYKVDPGVYAAETYVCGEVLDHALKAIERQGRGQGRAQQGAARGEGAGHAARPGELRRVRQRRSATSTSARSRRRAANTSTPSSRPIRT